MDLEQPIQPHRLPIFHEFPPAEDDHVVRYQRRRRLGHGGQRRAAGLEAEVLWRIAFDFCEGFAEDGPEGEAEGAIEGWWPVDEPGGLGDHVAGV